MTLTSVQWCKQIIIKCFIQERDDHHDIWADVRDSTRDIKNLWWDKEILNFARWQHSTQGQRAREKDVWISREGQTDGNVGAAGLWSANEELGERGWWWCLLMTAKNEEPRTHMLHATCSRNMKQPLQPLSVSSPRQFMWRTADSSFLASTKRYHI